MLDVSHTEGSGSSVEGSVAYRASRNLAPGETAAPASPAASFRLARRRFLAGERLDMRALALELGVSRQTLYRWTGSREELLADILFSLSDASFEQAKRETAHLAGAERLLAVFRHHVAAIVSSAPLQTFVRRETQTALRILTSRHGSVNARTIHRLAALYRSEQEGGRFAPRADIDTLAFAVVCLTESFIYNDARAAVEPEVDRAAAVVALLLGAG
jgi:AcrR family transcriptional regulator